MSYEAANEGLTEVLQSVTGLTRVLDYEPSSIPSTPMVYHLLDSFSRTQEGQVTVMRYRKLIRLIVLWQDNEKAEQKVIPFVNAIPAALDADPQLGGRIERGFARVSPDADAIAGFVRIGGVMYRSLDIFADIVDKAAYQSGI